MAEKRDTRRAFTQTQKKEILYQQNMKCAKCHEPLDPRTIHYHHIKPWSFGGRTITQNGAAVCPTCHEELSHKERLKKVDIARPKTAGKGKTKAKSIKKKTRRRTSRIDPFGVSDIKVPNVKVPSYRIPKW